MIKPISKIASEVTASPTLAINALSKKMQSQGIDIVSFGAGEPDFDTPENIKKACIDAIISNKTRYSAVSGIDELKLAVCDRLKSDLDIDYTPASVVVTSGAKHIIYTALICLLEHGEEVIIPSPYWVSYPEMVKQAYGVPVFIHTTSATNFKITAEDLEKAITDKTKVLILNNPSNPTGTLYTKAELQTIADICVKHGIYVISDEIYYKLVYDDKKFTSLASCGEDIKNLAILIHGVSKTYCMTGFRIGYALCNHTLAKAMSNYLSHSISGACTISQYGAVEALNGEQSTIETMRQAFESRRNHFVSRVNQIENLSCISPDASFYLMMNISYYIGTEMYGKVIHTAEDFAELLLEKGLVATVPCTGFGDTNYLRWSYATSMENIDKGIDRLIQFIQKA